MKLTIREALATAGIAALGLICAPTGSAQCTSSPLARPSVTNWPEVKSMSAEAVAAEASAPRDQIGNPSPVSIVGLWRTTATSGGQVVDQGIDAWHADGTETLNDTAPGHFCLGVWERTGPFSYKKYHPGFQFDPNGNLVGTVVIREQVVLARNGNSYSGTQTVDFFDLNGNNFLHLTAAITGQRLTADD
jgi:hypothetical protein